MQIAQIPRITSFIRKVGLSGRLWATPDGELALDKGAELLPEVDDIVLGPAFASRRELFARIGRHMEYSHDVDRDDVTRSLEAREDAGSTALGRGVAVPQARVRGLDRVRSMYLRLKSPIELGAPDGRPVTDVFVLLLPGAIEQRHIDMQVQVAQMFADDAFRERLHRCTDARSVRQVLEAEAAAVA